MALEPDRATRDRHRLWWVALGSTPVFVALAWAPVGGDWSPDALIRLVFATAVVLALAGAAAPRFRPVLLGLALGLVVALLVLVLLLSLLLSELGDG